MESLFYQVNNHVSLFQLFVSAVTRIGAQIFFQEPLYDKQAQTAYWVLSQLSVKFAAQSRFQ
jgi:hypothetical protein